MKYANFLIKPASGLCNMRCRYCFYEDKMEHGGHCCEHIMSNATSELLIAEAFRAVGFDGMVSFAFQGGEPTLAGLDYFRHFVEYTEKANVQHIPVSYSIQTNGLSINDTWAEFFAQNNFLVGISMDGDEKLHDTYRIDAAKCGTWERVQKAILCLKEHNVKTNLLCVVTKQCAKKGRKVYQALKRTGIRYLQFIPCLDPLGQPRGKMAWSLTAKDYGEFLCAVFDEWYHDWSNGRYTSVRLFEDYVHRLIGLPAGTCSTSGSCGSYFVVEADGSLYPCDFYVLDEWKIGKLGEMPLPAIAASAKANRFLADSIQHPSECAACRWNSLCSGGCKRDWVEDISNRKRSNCFCNAFKMFFEYSEKKLLYIAAAENKARSCYMR